MASNSSICTLSFMFWTPFFMCKTCNTQWCFISLGTTDYGIYEFEISICDDDKVHWLRSVWYQSSIALHQLHWVLLLLFMTHEYVFTQCTAHYSICACIESAFKCECCSCMRAWWFSQETRTRTIAQASNLKSNESNDISFSNISTSQNVFLSTFW